MKLSNLWYYEDWQVERLSAFCPDSDTAEVTMVLRRSGKATTEDGEKRNS